MLGCMFLLKEDIKRMEKCFIDSNVIINYIIFKRLHLIAKNKKEFVKLMKEKNPQAFYSYGLIEGVRLAELPTFSFSSSNFALGEVAESIIDQLCLEELNKVGIPIKFWKNMRRKYIREEASKDKINTEIYSELIAFYETFVQTELIILNETTSFLSNIAYLLKAQGQQDAFLLSQSKKEECEFFITCDANLKGVAKGYKSPQEFCSKKITEKEIRRFLENARK